MTERKISETIPAVADEVSAIASAHAPIIFLDGVPTYGFFNGVVNMTVEALRYMTIDGQVVRDKVVTAHLRMSVPAMLSLKDAVAGVELLLKPAENPEGPKN